MDYTNLFNLDNRIALVIGAGSGIGQAAALGLAAHGAAVICADTRRGAAEETSAKIGEKATAIETDITKTEDVERMFSSVVEQHRRLDIVVTTPGANVRKPITSYEDDEFDKVIELNLKGTFRVLREAGRIMSEQGRGSTMAVG